MSKQKRIGQQAEFIAASHLKQHGLTIVEHNFNCRFGEIDLIAKDQETLVFIEVRYRNKRGKLSPAETLDYYKVNRIITTARYFLSHSRQYQTTQCRFDFIGITGDEQKPDIEWIKNAFQA